MLNNPPPLLFLKDANNSFLKSNIKVFKTLTQSIKSGGGFTLIEVVVAVFVLTIGVLAAFNVVQNITVYSRVTSSRLTATYLAQEGMELVRNQRDSNWLVGGMDWEANKADLIGSFVGTESDLLEKFDRIINISDENDKIEISVEVVWEEKGKAQPPVIAQTELYNWYGQ